MKKMKTISCLILISFFTLMAAPAHRINRPEIQIMPVIDDSYCQFIDRAGLLNFERKKNLAEATALKKRIETILNQTTAP